MKFLIDNRGQTCNKFWSYLYSLSKCIDNGEQIYLLYYDKTIDDYPYLRYNPYFKYPFYSSFLNRLFGVEQYMLFLQHFFNNRFYTHETLFKKFPHFFINGWEQRRYLISPDSKPIIRKLFLPDNNITNCVNNLFIEKRKNYDLIIGVHIRRGDYATWREGRYFYSFRQYADVCRKLLSYFPEKKIFFFLASNENIDKGAFEGIQYFIINNGGVTYDLYGLSICDYIVGPPSSFSRFAAFRGDVEISFLTDIDHQCFNFRKMLNYAYYDSGDPVEFSF